MARGTKLSMITLLNIRDQTEGRVVRLESHTNRTVVLLINLFNRPTHNTLLMVDKLFVPQINLP
jgi:hypothetical protein